MLRRRRTASCCCAALAAAGSAIQPGQLCRAKYNRVARAGAARRHLTDEQKTAASIASSASGRAAGELTGRRWAPQGGGSISGPDCSETMRRAAVKKTAYRPGGYLRADGREYDAKVTRLRRLQCHLRPKPAEDTRRIFGRARRSQPLQRQHFRHSAKRSTDRPADDSSAAMIAR